MTQAKHIEIAKKAVEGAGIIATYSGYSDSHGISVYFIAEDGRKIRVSTHSVTKTDRMFNETHINFPTKTFQPINNTAKANFILTQEMIETAAKRKSNNN